MGDGDKRYFMINRCEAGAGETTLFSEPANKVHARVCMGDDDSQWGLSILDQASGDQQTLDYGRMQCGPDARGDMDACYPEKSHTAELRFSGPDMLEVGVPVDMQQGGDAMCVLGDALSEPAQASASPVGPQREPDHQLLVLEVEAKQDAPGDRWMESSLENLMKFAYDKRTDWPGAVQDMTTVLKHLREFGGSQFYVWQGKGPGKVGKTYLVFKGNPRKPGKYVGLRSLIRGNGPYSFKNPHIAQLGFGTRNALKAGARSTVISFILVAGIDVMEELMRDEPTLRRLGINLGVDTVKLLLSFLAGAGAAALVASSSVAVPVIAVAGAGLVVGLVVGLALDWIDNRLGITAWLQQRARELEEEARQEVNGFLNQLFYELEWCAMHPHQCFAP